MLNWFDKYILDNADTATKDSFRQAFEWYGDKRHFRPWYDSNADYNTNAKSYYDYLAKLNGLLQALIDTINKLHARDINIQDTSSVHLTKEGEWLNDDDIELFKAYVKISGATQNALKQYEDGLYVFDFSDEIAKLHAKDAELQGNIDALRKHVDDSDKHLQDQIDALSNKAADLQNQINALGNRVSSLESNLNNLNNKINQLQEQLKQLQRSITINGKIEIPRNVDIRNSNNLADGVDLGNITDNTRISIVATLGSTRLNSIFYVGDLKGTAAHVFMTNAMDKNDGLAFCEAFTRIMNGKLYCTTVHNFDLSKKNGFYSVHNPWRENNNGDPGITGNTPYYDDVDPEYKAGTNRTRDLLFQSVTVYDQVDPIKVS